MASEQLFRGYEDDIDVFLREVLPDPAYYMMSYIEDRLFKTAVVKCEIRRRYKYGVKYLIYITAAQDIIDKEAFQASVKRFLKNKIKAAHKVIFIKNE